MIDSLTIVGNCESIFSEKKSQIFVIVKEKEMLHILFRFGFSLIEWHLQIYMKRNNIW